MTTMSCATLPADADIHSAEATAVFEAMSRFCTSSAVILCDRKSLLDELIQIKNGRGEIPVHVLKMIVRREVLGLEGINIDLVWVPAHSGVKLNEVADLLAKFGTMDDGEGPRGRNAKTRTVHEISQRIASKG